MKNVMKKNGAISRVLTNIVSLAVMFLCMAAAAIVRDGRLLGCDVTFATKAEDGVPSAEIESQESTGDTLRMSTDRLGTKVYGYGGHVPVEIVMVNGRIDTIVPLENNETPRFFERVTSKNLFARLKGLTADEALRVKVDAVTGATYSSQALIDNVRIGLESVAKGTGAQHNSWWQRVRWSVKLVVGLLVILAGAVIPLFTHNQVYRFVQQLLNVGVLGFWCGVFVDYTMMLGYVSGGVNAATALPGLLLLVVAFVYPLLGQIEHYCNWVCPLGSLQGIVGRFNKRGKLKLSAFTVRVLTLFRRMLWCVLMLGLWLGFWGAWIDYELFTAFMVTTASWWLIGVLAAIVLLSVFVNRPYCRFVCPTGVVLRKSHDLDSD